MSQSPNEWLSESAPAARDYSTFVQQRLSARQVKRAAKAAERRSKSDALKEEGDDFFREGKFLYALERYRRAIDVHGPSAKPALLADLAAVYLNLNMYPEAHDAADRALVADPRSAEARYRRGMARKHMEMWTAADIDFRTLLDLDPENKDAEAELAFVEERRFDPSYCDEEEEDMNTFSDYEAPALDDDPELGESLSESTDCEHTGNGIPCKFYNRNECKHGRDCRYSHAPDDKSERDALGRNVCRYYLFGVCKFGERCSYLHSKEYLLQEGWWSTTEGVEKERKLYDLLQTTNKAIADYNKQAKASGTGRTSKKRGKKNRDGRAHPGFEGSRSGVSRVGRFKAGPSSQRLVVKNRKKSPTYSGGWDSDDNDDNGLAMCGFTGREVEELVCYGVNPWDDDTWDVFDALHGYC